jgi:S-adenosylmethionine:tRNA ribosyltransferase-isomerase
LDVKDFDYDLPQELIAQTPIENREMSRLLVMNRKTGELEHRIFHDIIEYLNPGDCLVLNDTRVLPARLYGEKEGTGGKMEFVLLKQMDLNRWEVMVRPGKKAKEGKTFVFGDGLLKGIVEKVMDNGNRQVFFEYEGNFYDVIDRIGLMPLPPYITESLNDRERYQTVYAKHLGSAAAPTAGLHFTQDLLHRLEEKGVKIVYCTLHVGIGTFRPVKAEHVEDHRMHSEHYTLTQEAADTINAAKAAGKRIIAVGTTSCRTLESIGKEDGTVEATQGDTSIFIYPGYRFKVIDGLITNFHLPQSTLVMLVSAFSTREHVLHAYEEAIKERYRFFSFGDAMFLY